ncbi:MAG: DinB family protein [Planctomycetota bacterium]|nr:MAG: DinB family protein [Planctomycetota bacterium]REK27844.1 MAG: DinB family protein [Planctomycetota bacterium]REK32844.1 MAG: DinB family protein [Planctomycetota bacterium]
MPQTDVNVIDFFLDQWEFERGRTLALLDLVAEHSDSRAVLGWRPGAGRAHIAWQLMHIGITEELFATERFAGTTPGFAEFVPRFRGGSTPDDEIPSVETIRDVLTQSRDHLVQTVKSLDTSTLDESSTDFLQQRGWTVRMALKILGWHEAHHQGQAHMTLNLWKAAHPA